MSSILKALKKIEEDSAPPQKYPSLVKSIDTKQALNSGPRTRWRIRRYLKYIYILLVIAVAITVLISQRRLIIAKVSATLASVTQRTNDTPTSGKPITFKAKVPSAPTKTQTAPPVKTRHREIPTKPPAKPPVSGSNRQNLQAKTKASTNRSRSSLGSIQADTSKRQPKTELLAKQRKPQKKTISPSNSAPTANSVAGKRPAKRKSTVKATPKVTYDRFEDSRLKLQALAWSNDAAKRMAVINDRIVHEGDSVDGYQVTKIRPDDVIVKSGGKSWRLVFGLR